MNLQRFGARMLTKYNIENGTQEAAAAAIAITAAPVSISKWALAASCAHVGTKKVYCQRWDAQLTSTICELKLQKVTMSWLEMKNNQLSLQL